MENAASIVSLYNVVEAKRMYAQKEPRCILILFFCIRSCYFLCLDSFFSSLTVNVLSPLKILLNATTFMKSFFFSPHLELAFSFSEMLLEFMTFLFFFILPHLMPLLFDYCFGILNFKEDYMF